MSGSNRYRWMETKHFTLKAFTARIQSDSGRCNASLHSQTSPSDSQSERWCESITVPPQTHTFCLHASHFPLINLTKQKCLNSEYS